MNLLSLFTRRTPKSAPAVGPRLAMETLELRENPSAGYFDGTFGQGGATRVDVHGSDWFTSKPAAVAVQADGKTLIAGTVYNGLYHGDDFAVIRLNQNGSLDTTFGSGGRAIVGFDRGNGATEAGDPSPFLADQASAMAVDSQGRIVVVGTVTEGYYGFAHGFGAMRLTANGQLDTGFGTGGKAVIDLDLGNGFMRQSDFAHGVAIDKADGNIVIVGESTTDWGTVMSVARLKTNGQLNTAFDGDGKQTVDFGTGGYGRIGRANAVAIDPAGRIVVAGAASADIAGNTDFAVACLTRAGALDRSFHGTGKTTVPINYEYHGKDEAVAVDIDPSGRIVLGGTATANNFSTTCMAAARLRSDGALDTTFGAAGVTGDTSRPFVTGAMTVDSKGRVYLVGAGNSGTIETVRLAPNGYYDNSYGVGGRSYAGVGGLATNSVGGIALDAYDRVIAVGAVAPAGNWSYEFGVVRLQSDTSFFLALGVAPGTVTLSSLHQPVTQIVSVRSVLAPNGGADTVTLTSPARTAVTQPVTDRTAVLAPNGGTTTVTLSRSIVSPPVTTSVVLQSRTVTLSSPRYL